MSARNDIEVSNLALLRAALRVMSEVTTGDNPDIHDMVQGIRNSLRQAEAMIKDIRHDRQARIDDDA